MRLISTRIIITCTELEFMCFMKLIFSWHIPVWSLGRCQQWWQPETVYQNRLFLWRLTYIPISSTIVVRKDLWVGSASYKLILNLDFVNRICRIQVFATCYLSWTWSVLEAIAQIQKQTDLCRDRFEICCKNITPNQGWQKVS